MTNFRNRRSYASDPGLCDRVFALLDTWIPALNTKRRQAERLRWRWEDCSTPFVHERDGRVIAHVGVLESRWVWGGEEHRMGGVHAVCTLASERRRGLYRELIEEALVHCDERYDSVDLCTEHPEYYEPFGFRVIPEHRFRTQTDPRAGRHRFRSLDLGRSSELDLLERLLATRTPTSRILGVVREQDIFKFNQSSGELQYCEELDLIAVMYRSGGQLEIDDLVGPALPDLEEFLAHIGHPIDEVVFHFRPDRLGVGATPELFRYDDDVLMIRGQFPLDGLEPKFMLPPPARH
jgi:predicted N-acetyltransferase YhbS